MNPLYTLLLSALLCVTSQAFVTSVKGSVPSTARSTLRVQSRIPSSRTGQTHGWSVVSREGSRARGMGTPGMGMVIRGRPMPELSEEELATMTRAREEENRKLEAFVDEKRTEKEARRQEQQEEKRNKVVNRMKAEKEDAEQKKVYIPQRLEEIEREQASLKDRVTQFNDKIKDSDLRQL